MKPPRNSDSIKGHHHHHQDRSSPPLPPHQPFLPLAQSRLVQNACSQDTGLTCAPIKPLHKPPKRNPPSALTIENTTREEPTNTTRGRPTSETSTKLTSPTSKKP